jgi:hypothetical protein
MTFYLNYFIDLAKKIFGTSSEHLEQLSNKNDANIAASSFQQSSCLQLLACLNQQEWRIPLLWSSLLDIFSNNMTHPYKAIREKNSSYEIDF